MVGGWWVAHNNNTTLISNNNNQFTIHISNVFTTPPTPQTPPTQSTMTTSTSSQSKLSLTASNRKKRYYYQNHDPIQTPSSSTIKSPLDYNHTMSLSSLRHTTSTTTTTTTTTPSRTLFTSSYNTPTMMTTKTATTASRTTTTTTKNRLISKPIIDSDTLDIIKIEIESILPISLYHIAETIQTSHSIRYHYMNQLQDNKHDNHHKIMEKDEKEGDKGQTTTNRFYNNNYYYSQQERVEDEMNRNIAFNNAMKNLMENIGSMDHMLYSWDDVLTFLKQVVVFNNTITQDDDDIINNNNNMDDGQEMKIPLGNQRKSKDKTPIKRSSGRKYNHGSNTNKMKSTFKKNNSVSEYEKQIMDVQRRMNGPITWFRESVLSFRTMRMMKTFNKQSNDDNSIRNNNKKKTKITNQYDFFNFGNNNRNLAENNDRKSDLSITEQLEKLQMSRTTEAERQLRVKEMAESSRIEKAMKNREKEEIEKRIEEERLNALKKEEEAKLAASNLLRPLTDEEKAIVENAMYGHGSDDEVMAETDTDSVLRKSMRTLKPCSWLNDEVIHYFYLMLSRRDEEICKREQKRRSHFFKSFFLTKLFDEGGSDQYKYANVKRWSKVSLPLY